MSFKKICTATINGHRWEVGFGYPGKEKGRVHDGQTFYDRRRIVIQRRGRTRDLIETLCHELLHAHIEALKEETVEHFSSSMGKILPKLLPFDSPAKKPTTQKTK